MGLTADQADRAAGVLLGTATGDALGAGYEFSLPTRKTVIDMIGGGAFRWEPGEWTDDTSMAIAIARAAADTGALHETAGLDAVAAQFVAWIDSRPKDVGGQTRAVLNQRSRTARQMRARAAKIPGRRGGNGSLMRTAPVALVYLDDADTCAVAAALVSSLTHADQRAEEACALWTLAIRHAVLHGTYDGLRAALAYVDADYWAPLLDQAETSRNPRKDFPKNGWVVHALQTAWWAITHSDTLPGALELAVRAGRDTDTTAAIAGGLLGARWGASAVPERWQNLLHGYPGMRADDLTDLAQRIVARKPARPPAAAPHDQ
ncbi:ADP-ribosylglycohydrolase family protein [Nocardia pseudovaccinii]|uniref:ADP-ribosylglycohydrolase family protein n=1 Tax=Nocardia pseudovaccinii TaxID=189540 RepID=UPI0007A4F52B|nr:ADP-ribosylglycohydrolase family protein [Nocardia pseudovaccinii]